MDRLSLLGLLTPFAILPPDFFRLLEARRIEDA